MQPIRSRKKRATPRRARGSWAPIIIVGAVALAAVVLIVVLSSALEGGGKTVIPSHIASRTVEQNGTVLGSESAPVTVVEYFRFDCIHCADFALQTAPGLEEEYVNTGKVRFEAHPLALEGKLLDASVAAACAGDQGRYWDYFDVLFANYRENGDGAFKSGRLKEYAQKLEMDTEAFNSCLDSDAHADEITAETRETVAAGIQATPNFFIGPTREMTGAEPPYAGQTNVQGAQSYAAFKSAIDAALQKAQ